MDCDGDVDEGVLLTFYRDNDSDTYGIMVSDQPAGAKCALLPPGYVANHDDWQ